MDQQIQGCWYHHDAVRPCPCSHTLGHHPIRARGQSSVDVIYVPQGHLLIVKQGVMNDSHTFEAIAGGLEYVSSLIVRYAMIEAFYLQDPSMARQHLNDAIVRLYTAILVYLCKARRYYGQNTTGTAFHG